MSVKCAHRKVGHDRTLEYQAITNRLDTQIKTKIESAMSKINLVII